MLMNLAVKNVYEFDAGQSIHPNQLRIAWSDEQVLASFRLIHFYQYCLLMFLCPILRHYDFLVQNSTTKKDFLDFLEMFEHPSWSWPPISCLVQWASTTLWVLIYYEPTSQKRTAAAAAAAASERTTHFIVLFVVTWRWSNLFWCQQAARAIIEFIRLNDFYLDNYLLEARRRRKRRPI